MDAYCISIAWTYELLMMIIIVKCAFKGTSKNTEVYMLVADAKLQ